MKRSTPAARAPEVRAGYLVGRVDRLVRASLDEVLADVGLSVPEYTTLSVLAARPGLSNARLARRALVSSQAMHRVTRSLEDRGLIERQAATEGGRVLAAAVTPEGRRLLEQLAPRVERAEHGVLAVLSDTERRELVRLLAIVAGVDVDE